MKLEKKQNNNKMRYIARQHNNFIDITLKMSMNAYKLFLFAISKIKTTDKDLPIITINLKEVKDLFAIKYKDKDNIKFSYLRELAEEIQGVKGLSIIEGNTEVFPPLAIPRIHLETLEIQMEFYQGLKPYLIDLQNQFYTKSDICFVFSLPSMESIRMYLLLKSRFSQIEARMKNEEKTLLENAKQKKEDISKIKITDFNVTAIEKNMVLKELKEKLIITDETYNNFAQLKRGKLDVIQKNINENKLSDIRFDYFPVKEIGSKKVESVTFKIYKKENPELESAEIINENKGNKTPENSPDQLEKRYYAELACIVSEMKRNLTKEQITCIKINKLAKSMNAEEIKKHKLFGSLFFKYLLTEDQKHYESFESWKGKQDIQKNEP